MPTPQDEARRAVKLKPVSAEATRMCQAGVGTLAAAGDESEAWRSGGGGRAGDESRTALSLDLADDETGRLRIFRVDDDSELLLLADSGEGYGGAEAGCWASSDMIIAACAPASDVRARLRFLRCRTAGVVLLFEHGADARRYDCKNGGLHVIYTWEGQTASLRARTASSLQVSTLAGACDWLPSSAEHQLYRRPRVELRLG